MMRRAEYAGHGGRSHPEPVKADADRANQNGQKPSSEYWKGTHCKICKSFKGCFVTLNGLTFACRNNQTGYKPRIVNGVNFWIHPHIVGLDSAKVDAMPPLPGEGDNQPQLEIVNLATVQAKEVSWLWPQRFPSGMLSLLVAQPEAGKTSIACDMTARVTTGAEWPDGSGRAPKGRVVWLSTEDSLEYTMRPRLDAAGADVSKVDFVRGVLTVSSDGKKSQRGLRLDIDIERLEQYLADNPDVVLVIADPLPEILGRIDSHKNDQVRSILAPLCRIAEKFGPAILGITHFAKADGGKAMNKTMGSLAFVAVARAVWGIVHDADNDNRRLLLSIKCNIAKRSPGLAFQIGEHAVVQWETGAVNTTVDAAFAKLAETAKDRGKLETAVDWLRNRLAGGISVESSQLIKEANEADISYSTFKRAKANMSLKSEKEKGEKNGRWLVRLPQNAHEPVEPVEKVGTLGTVEILHTEQSQEVQEAQESQQSQEDQD